MSFFLPILKKYGHLDNLHMTVCNVGSRKKSIEDDYASQGWEIFAPNLSIYGFDADADACDEANADIDARQVNWKEMHFPLALGKSIEERTLYVTKHPMCSSLFPPNELFLSKFWDLPEMMGLDFSFDIETTTLDEFCQSESVHEIDFLQIDVQGAELDVLAGAKNIFGSVLGLQTEVSFSPLYIGQPLFADVDTYLRQQNFSLFAFGDGCHLRRTPVRSSRRRGQLLWGDAFYLRNITSICEMNSSSLKPQQILKIACIADVMNFPDYCLELLKYLVLEFGNHPEYNFADLIVESLSGLPDLVANGLANLELIQDIRDYISEDLITTYSL